MTKTTTIRSLMGQFGVTRLARVTGLDRCGVEVVAAVRPGGHVLQVSQGKGRTLAQAQWSALGEAIELAVAEQPEPSRLVWRREPDSEWNVGDGLLAWVRADDGGWVPAHEVYCPPAGTVWLGPVSLRWRSNGLGFHPSSKRKAARHALFEALERDALARVLPRGWWLEDVAERRLVSPSVAPGFAAFAFDLSWGTVPVAGVLLFDLEEGAVPLTAGYAARATLSQAVEAALLEAAQSRLTEIHGAREDVSLGDRDPGRALLAGVRSLPVRERLPVARAQPRPSIVELRRDPFVVKAVSPALLVSELL